LLLGNGCTNLPDWLIREMDRDLLTANFTHMQLRILYIVCFVTQKSSNPQPGVADRYVLL